MSPRSSTRKLNKIIWTFWTGPKCKMYTKCQLSWRYYLKDWKINVVTLDNIDSWNLVLPSTFDKLPPTAKSDIIRINLLYKYGGVWLDATIQLLRNLDWLLKLCNKGGKHDYFACKAWDAEFVENWLLAVNRVKNPYIKKWRDSLCDVLEKWPNITLTKYYRGKKYTRNDNYFMMYQCYCYLINNDSLFKPAIILPNSVQLAFIPVEFPLDIMDPRYFIKYTSNCRKRATICQKIFNILILTIILFLFYKIGKFRFFPRSTGG